MIRLETSESEKKAGRASLESIQDVRLASASRIERSRVKVIEHQAQKLGR